jgi:hypothetical protein
MVLRLVEETVVAQAVWFNPRIVATMRIPLGKPFGFDLEAPISQGPKDLPIARQTPLQFTIHKTQKRER